MNERAFWSVLGVTLLALVVLAAAPGQAAQAVPEVIDNGHYMAKTEDHIYYSTDGSTELKCEDLMGDVYGRVLNGGGQSDRERLLINCEAAPFPNSAMVSSGEVTYFISSTDNQTIHALFRRPADGSQKAERVTLNQNLAPRALAYDEDFVYYATLDGVNSLIIRRHLVSDATQVVAAVGDMLGNSINGLALDDNYIYWTEGGAGGNGRVRRALKGGGPPSDVALALALPVHLMAYGDYIYWAEEEGDRIARRLKNGAGATQLLYQTDRPVTALYLFNNLIYFGTGETGTPSGSLWRAATNGKNPTLMASGFPPPREIAWVDGWIYWVDGKLRRLPPNAVSDTVDYIIGRMEVTQGVQDGAHSMPLVARKTTMVRIYGREWSGTSNGTVSARLYGYNDGIPLPGSPLQPVANDDLDLGPGLPLRADVDDTYLFQLPNDWTNLPSLELQAEVNPNTQVFETRFDNNRYPAAPKSFEPGQRLVCLITYPVAATTPAGATVIFDNDPAVYDSRIVRAKAMLPTLVMAVKESTVIWLEDGDGQQVPHNLPADPNEAMLLAAIGATGELSDPPLGCLQGVTRYAGIVDKDAAFAPNFGGRASGRKFWARWWDDATAVDYVQPAGGFLWAHELAHTLDRPHVNCGSASNPGFYPYPRCQNDENGSENAAWGYDPISGAALNPADHSDLMAYGTKRWVSDFTWKCLYNYVGDRWGLPGTSVSGCNDPLALSSATGQNETSDTGEIQGSIVYLSPDMEDVLGHADTASLFAYNDIDHLTVMQETRLQSTPRQGQWKALLLDSRGSELASKFIESGSDINDSDSKTASQQSVLLSSTEQPALVQIRETATGSVLFERALSENAPRLRVTSATINREGDMEVAFTADDPDGDPVQIIAQYIEPDGRKQVMALMRHREEPQFSCDPCTWPGRTLHGGSGTVRVLASDGMRTTVAEMPVNVPTKPPEVSLFAAQHGPLDADGFATYGVWPSIWDAEDGSAVHADQVDAFSVSWSVNGTQMSKSFPEMIIIARKDSGNLNVVESSTITVELTVTDSDKKSTTAKIDLDLQPPQDSVLLLPVILGN